MFWLFCIVLKTILYFPELIGDELTGEEGLRVDSVFLILQLAFWLCGGVVVCVQRIKEEGEIQMLWVVVVTKKIKGKGGTTLLKMERRSGFLGQFFCLIRELPPPPIVKGVD